MHLSTSTGCIDVLIRGSLSVVAPLINRAESPAHVTISPGKVGSAGVRGLFGLSMRGFVSGLSPSTAGQFFPP